MTLGIFDSGEGGHNLLRYLRARNRRDDVLFLCDRANAPYGTKRDYELSGIVNDNVNWLKKMGADRVIIACCTACTVYDSISDREEVYPILTATARAADRIAKGKIAVIATGRTVASHAFSHAMKKESVEIEAQPLVSIIDSGESDSLHSKETEDVIRDILKKADGADTLVLGCTHFSSLKGLCRRIGRDYGIRHIVDAARVGATLLPRCDGEGGIDYVFNTKNKGG